MWVWEKRDKREFHRQKRLAREERELKIQVSRVLQKDQIARSMSLVANFNEKQELRYSETWELGTPNGLRKTVLISEVVLFLRSISTYWIQLGTEVAVLNSQGVPISQVVSKTGFTVYTLLNIRESGKEYGLVYSYVLLVLAKCVTGKSQR